jgi:hypothetical protein
LFNSKIYATNTERVQDIIEIIVNSEIFMMLYTEKTMDVLNGTISKLDFQNVRCTRCDPICPNILK